jgi:hypothetical protein
MKYKLVNAKELEQLLKTARTVKQDERDEAYNNGYEDGKSEYEGELDEALETVEEQKATLKKKNREIANLNTELEVLNKQKNDARDVVTKRLANENIAADLKAREELVAKRETKVQTREDAVSNSEVSEEDKQYKSGYADGIADGVRKIGEITQVDRQNAMDVAMVSAASHTQPETVKAVLDGSKAIKSSLANKEDK